MYFLVHQSVQLLTIILIVSSSSIIGEDDITASFPDCYSLDRCKVNEMRSRKVDSSRERNCACDQECAVYADCCIDSSYVSKIPFLRQDSYVCVPFDNFRGYFMISQCPEEETSAKLREQCEKETFESDPLANMPVTDPKTRITYRNIYCATCNSDLKDKTFWNPKLSCPNLKQNLTQSYVRSNLIYLQKEKQWGIKVKQESQEKIHECNINAVPPDTIQSALRDCKPELISECPNEWEDERVREACTDYQAVVYHSTGAAFRNPHCAYCNGENVSSLTCLPLFGRSFSGLDGRSYFTPSSFAILLDINIMTDESSSVGKVTACQSSEQIYDPFIKECRSVFCNFKNFQLVDGKCVPNRDVIKLQGFETNKSDDLNEIADKDEINFLHCPKMVITKEEYTVIDKDTIFVPTYERFFNQSEFKIEDGLAFICTHFLESEISMNRFSEKMGFLTIVGLGISITALIFHLFTFCLVSEIRNLSGQNLVSLSVSLIVAYSCFILIQFEKVKKSKHACTLFGLVMYYFFLSSICWMNVMAFDVWRTLRRATKELRVSKGRQLVRFLLYSIYAWLLSAIFVIISITADHYNYLPSEFRPQFGQSGNCWFAKKKALIIFFAGPVAVIMIINIVLFILSASMIIASTSNKSQLSTSKNNRNNYKLYLRLWLLMGLTWIVGFLASFSNSMYLWYIFVILNTLQGLFIFIGFSCKRKAMSTIKSKMAYLSSITRSSSLGEIITPRTYSTGINQNLRKSEDTIISSKQNVTCSRY